MLSIGWTELLIVFAIWLLLFGGWRVLRQLFWESRWIVSELQGDVAGAQQAELRLGKVMAECLMAEMPLDPDASRTKTVREIGRQLTRALPGQRRSFRFQVVRSQQPNAFALPGGLVFVTSSMVAFCGRDGDALAFVAAHEMAHVFRSHARDRVLSSFALRALTSLVTGGGWLGRLVRRQLNRVLTSAYSQDQEFEADAEAVRLLRRADFDPRGGERLLARLDQASGSTGHHNYFATHPPLPTRRARLQSLVLGPPSPPDGSAETSS